MKNPLQQITILNGIAEEILEEALYKDIMEMILREICEYMKDNSTNYVAIRKIYYQTPNNILAAKKIVHQVCNIALPEDDLEWIDMCIRAFFHKKPTRKLITNEIRENLWKNQNAQCAICGKTVTIESLHVDHIIPWDYVGDELSDNYQALCSFCNSHKSNNVSVTVSNLFFTKRGDKL